MQELIHLKDDRGGVCSAPLDQGPSEPGIVKAQAARSEIASASDLHDVAHILTWALKVLRSPSGTIRYTLASEKHLK